jgi:hypothetical protein
MFSSITLLQIDHPIGLVSAGDAGRLLFAAN